MMHDKDKILIRAKDITLMLSVLTLLGFLFGPAKKIFQLEQTIEDVKDLKTDVGVTKTNIAVINAQYADIQKQLEQVNWQLRAMRGVPTPGGRTNWRNNGD